MKNKTILIAETHEEQSKFIKDAIKENNINVSVMNIETNNSEDMKNAIIDSQPDIVFTNEVKNDRPASDVIKEIQSNIKHFQPIFIISSGYSTKDIDDICREKGIHIYSIKKPMDCDFIAKEIGKIADEKKTDLCEHLYYNFNEENINFIYKFIEDKGIQYIYDKNYRKTEHELSVLHDKFEKAPKKYRDMLKEFESLQININTYEVSFIYQYLQNKMNKLN